MSSKPSKQDPRNVPTAWFAVLESSLSKGNLEQVVQALDNLQRLGFDIHFNDGPQSVPVAKLTAAGVSKVAIINRLLSFAKRLRPESK